MRIFLIIIFLSLFSFAHSQELLPTFTKETVGLFELNSTGWELAVYKGKIKPNGNVRYFQIGFQEFIHPREERSFFDISSTINDERRRSFKLGKLVNFYSLHGTLGHKQYLTKLTQKKGVLLALNYRGGLSLGLEKPYYLTYIQFDTQSDNVTLEDFKFSEENRDFFNGAFLPNETLYGAAGFGTGFNEFKVIPGLHLSTGIVLDWTTTSNFQRQFEMGLESYIYTREVQLILDNNPQSIFLNIYARIGFGGKS